MKWMFSVIAISVLCAFTSFSQSEWPWLKRLPQLPGARLLAGYPPAALVLSDPDKAPVVVTEGTKYLDMRPSLSRDGNVIGTAQVLADPPVTANEAGYTVEHQLVSIGAYSRSEQRWRQYAAEYNFIGSTALALDGSKLAYAVARWDGRNNPVSQTMYVIDLKSGAERQYPIKGRHQGIGVSWSPDGRYLAYDTMPKRPYEGATEYQPEILVLDLEAGVSKRVAVGNQPAWSPSGEWIAYYYSTENTNVEEWRGNVLPSSPNRVMLVRPNGTGAKLLFKGRYFQAPPVWSPDSKTVLLSIGTDMMKGTCDLKLVDITTRKVTKIAEDAPPVFGWAAAN